MVNVLEIPGSVASPIVSLQPSMHFYLKSLHRLIDSGEVTSC